MALALLPALFLLHNDFWFWSDARLVLGLPAGMLYQVVFCLAATAAFWLVVTWAWPEHLEVEAPAPDGPGEGRRP